MTSQARKLLTRETAAFLRDDRVPVYHYRAAGSPVVKDGLAVISRTDLQSILAKHPNLQHTTKKLDPRARAVDIYQRDLLPPGGAMHGTEASNLAGVKLPVLVWVEGWLRGKGQGWKEIVVVWERVGGAVA